jgi:DNA-binding NtrC family response regulator
MSLHLPPLRDRTGDIPLLIRRFLRPGWTIDEAAEHAMERYSWPGNVRQLQNAIERAEIMADDMRIRLSDLPPEVHEAPTIAEATGTAMLSPNGDDLAHIERSHVLDILNREHGNKARAARALGISRRSLYRLLEKYDIPSA